MSPVKVQIVKGAKGKPGKEYDDGIMAFQSDDKLLKRAGILVVNTETLQGSRVASVVLDRPRLTQFLQRGEVLATTSCAGGNLRPGVEMRFWSSGLAKEVVVKNTSPKKRKDWSL